MGHGPPVAASSEARIDYILLGLVDFLAPLRRPVHRPDLARPEGVRELIASALIVPTLIVYWDTAAARVVEQKRSGWRSPIHPRTWLNSLERGYRMMAQFRPTARTMYTSTRP